jgi:hypothetical protein
MLTVNSTRSNKIQIILAGVLSVIAQGLLLLPINQTSPTPLPYWGCLATGVILFTIATIWIVTNIRVLRTGWRGNAHFILNQAVIVIGILLISDPSASISRLGGFILTSLITALTIYGILANTSSPILMSDKEEREKKEFVMPLEINKNTDALKEQVDIATKKLTKEKQRTLQLNYLIELSQQLNAELDPPIAAQRAVNTLEHAIKCTVVSLMLLETDRKEFITLASGGPMANIIPPGQRYNSDSGIHGRVTRQKKNNHYQ